MNGGAISSSSAAPIVPPKDASRYSASPSSFTSHELIPLPDNWYYFFGILEPLTVLSGAVYAIIFQNNYHDELVPNAFVPSATSFAAAVADVKRPFFSSVWPAVQHKASHGMSNLVASSHLPAATSLALGQLGSCESCAISEFDVHSCYCCKLNAHSSTLCIQATYSSC